ncbi:MAG: pyrroline-5-carboxylate reductase [Clostridia bacterium]|nr:pyrroline-5-carboxylate reductase [Oscillospiraceae bacterium]MBQ6702485.1 pyrroline-5-carboxylate reductase [Clostridia bacterium]
MLKGKFAFLGTGNMAGAIIRSMQGNYTPDNIVLFDKDTTKYDPYRNEAFILAETAPKAVELADFIFLSVKPQNFTDLLTEIKESGVSLENKTFISIAAGITTEFVCQKLGQNVAVIRTMPNTPLLVGKGVTALSKNEFVNEKVFKNICAVFASSGSAFTLPEEKMNDIIAVTSSSPAYVFLFIKSIYDAALEMGFENKDMLEVICKTVIGSTELLLKTGKTPDELITMVKSPKGTTEQALNVFEENKFSDIVKEAMLKCSERAEELSKGM